MTVVGGIVVNMAVVWLVAMLVLLGAEVMVPGLVCIWFAFGAFGALLSAMLGAPLWLQFVWFLLLSLLALWLTRPLAKKYVNGRAQPTNADRVIGREALVTEDIDNLRASGAVSVGGKEWSARTEEGMPLIPAGQVVKVLRIEGVKLIVESI